MPCGAECATVAGTFIAGAVRENQKRLRGSFLFLRSRLQLLQPLFKFGEALDQFALALVSLRLPLHFFQALFCTAASAGPIAWRC